MSVLIACKELKKRLDEFKEIHFKNEEVSFKKLVDKAYFEKINLSSSGFFKQSNIGLENENDTKIENFYHYFTCGVGFSEVELNVLNGTYKIIRSDVIMDVAESLSPYIDIGQIEGG
jgi:xanthine dehydrogenase molybdopterin-binding subunit B